jgi:chitinase
MKHLLSLLIPVLFFFGCIPSAPENTKDDSQKKDYKIIAYVHGLKDNWGEHFKKANQITHINYAFANIKDGKVIEGRDGDTENLIKLNELKATNPNLKIMISVGGWGWSGNFSDATLTEEAREIFANSAIEFMLKHKIDGIDLDWEYPGLPGAGNIHRPEDKENFTAILKLLREKLDALDNDVPYLLTIATGASQRYLDHTDMKTAHQYLDFINIMTYDFHGSAEKKTGHNANLFDSKYDDNEKVRSAKTAVDQHVKAGIPVEKIVLGVPFYGKYWTEAESLNNGLYQPAEGEAGGYDYTFIKDSLLTNPDFQTLWDTSANIPFLWRAEDGQFVTYENPKSIQLKADYVKENDLGGIMFWQFNGDDGTLLQAVYEHLK